MELLPRPCPLCSHESSVIHAAENIDADQLTKFSFASRKAPELMHHRLMLCAPCDLIYASPVPAENMLIGEYENASFDSSLEAGYAARTYSSYLPDGIINRALDIGTGGGEFLGELKKRGAQHVQGVEPSPAAIATASPEIKPFITQGAFDASQYEDGSFDLISCFQTLEHVSNPLQLCTDSYRLLKEGGSFYTVSHDYKGAVNRILGKSSPIYDIEHLQLFSKASLRHMLEQAGFDEIKIFSIWNRYPLQYWIRLLPLPAFLKERVGKVFLFFHLGGVSISLPVGNIGALAVKRRS